MYMQNQNSFFFSAQKDIIHQVTNITLARLLDINNSFPCFISYLNRQTPIDSVIYGRVFTNEDIFKIQVTKRIPACQHVK